MAKKENTETKIIETGEVLIQERGVNGFSFADIANIVGIRKASIHYYFPTKIDLVKSVLEHYIKHFFTSLDDRCCNLRSLEEVLTAYTEQFKNSLQKNYQVCLCSMLSMESFSLNNELRQEINTFFNKNVLWLQKKLEEFHIPEEQASTMANHLFVVIQGAQLITQNLRDISYFDSVASKEINSICSWIADTP
ncbi:TetR/AcrR family transcriptional regulator [Virgibacillus sp. NKC19-3]|uniref:TetR/AcrR family transcriptional regulator n=1 Tax=Virgibacillus saliphilus TaxID=2831674 RepID=UPI001C9B70BD|nr:TetR/AcrR family transcriptional regulator [Virgibacillus sp. NKC19-3]MBY7143545.1 TetR/AcrR family transcriptional regulator [Virgibacillus sp. NKC19-3]